MRVALPGPPLQRRAGGGAARRVTGRDAGQFGVSPWMGCRQTPQPDRGLSGQEARKARKRGAPLFGYFLSGTREKLTRPPQEDESSAFQDDQSGRAGPKHARAIPLRDLIATRVRHP